MAGDDDDRRLLLLLLNILSSLYPTNQQALDLAQQAGLDISQVPQNPRPRSTWWGILWEAYQQLAVDRLVVLARRDYPRHEGLRKASEGTLDELPGPELTWEPRQLARPEVIVGADDLLPVAFLDAGAEIARSVVRIKLGPRQFGSGFLIAKDLVLTNHHVLPTEAVARAAVIEVGCEETLAGVAVQGNPHATAVDRGYLAEETDDWAVVRIEPLVNAVPISLANSAVPAAGQRVFIIQHPGGGPKQVALGDNTVTYVGQRRIQYLTDTRPGSSGSPVFDRQWRVVAVHHSGGWMSQPDTKEMRFQNEGIAISVIRDALVAKRLLA